MLQNLLPGLILSLIVSGAAYLFKLLTPSGAFWAFVLGFLVFGFGGIPWSIVMILFFITSSGLSLIFKRRKHSAEEKYAKGSRRDGGQVLANGGIAGLFVIAHIVFPTSLIPWIGFCAVFAAANADTWATELGILSKKDPILITTAKKVEPGTSGAISLAGSIAAFAGALLIGFTASFFFQTDNGQSIFVQRALVVSLVTLGGFVGSMVDSWHGATLQAIYYCPQCSKETEKHPFHTCNTPTTLLRGKNWMNNDVVNVFCTFSASLLTIIVALIFFS